MRPSSDDGVAIAVLEPAPLLMVAVQQEGRGGRPEVQLHAGGQGFWVARMAAEMGGAPVLCAPLGGRAGIVTRALVEMDGVRVDAVECHRSSSVWISTGRDGDEADVVHTPPPPLDRHEVDRLYNVTVAAGLEAGVAVLTGLSHPAVMPADVYRRLSADLTANGTTVVADVSADALGSALAGGVDSSRSARRSWSTAVARATDRWKRPWRRWRGCAATAPGPWWSRAPPSPRSPTSAPRSSRSFRPASSR